MTKQTSLVENNAPTILEENRRLSKSLLWKIERQFFEQQGVKAWNTGKVPHYLTSNPFIANAYGQVAFGFLRDWYGKNKTNLDLNQPFYILELGAGSGRFAYHFLKKFWEYYPQSVLKDLKVKYILTDLAQTNVDFWQSHSSWQPLIEKGIVDFARFDAEKDRQLQLCHSKKTLDSESINNPLIVLANYFFDSIPQDVFSLYRGQLHETLITLYSESSKSDLEHPDTLQKIQVAYEDVPTSTDYYDEPEFNRILQYYQQRLADTTILFPHIGLKCIKNLRQLSADRLLLLTGDKGYSREEDLLNRGKPQLTHYKGCFSLMVNYNAIAQYIQNQNGRVLTTPHRHASLNICAFLLGNNDYIETNQGYQNAIINSSPDDFFKLKKGIEKNYADLTLQEMIAYLRLSGWDANIFFGCFPTLIERVPQASDQLKEELYWAIQHIWHIYYFIGEDKDLPFSLSMLLYMMGYYPEAAKYLEYSLQIHGDDANSFYNLAMCHYRLRNLEFALDCINKTLALESTFEAAKTMQIKLEAEVNRLNKI